MSKRNRLKGRAHLNLITDTSRQAGGVLYVVMDKFRTTCVKQPGTDKPLANMRKKYMDMIAKETGGVVEELTNAIKYVMASPCNLPKDHPQYSADKAAPKIKL